MMNTQQDHARDEAPWHHQPWFWFVMSPLILVILACGVTITIAVRNADDLVTGDYYKEGLLINKRLDARTASEQLGLQAEATFVASEVRVQISAEDSATVEQLRADALQLTLTHPASAERDQTIALRAQEPGVYVGRLQQQLEHRWYLTLGPVSLIEAAGNWRLVGEIDFTLNSATQLQTP